ncbi:MAG: hypothetical protein ABS76_01405 [Pelagibacterium sp. SCN 64-44]|nr:MAG: hypothetical protein ABS76_01405 [Pelagibacterium sp. SCN 64-44]
MDKRIHKAIRLIEAGMGEPVRLGEIAERVGLSRPHFNRLFVAATQETPSDYLRRIRLDTAAARLRWNKHSVGAAAIDVGYDSQPSFTQAFARRHGVSPSVFRQDEERWPVKDSTFIHERRVQLVELDGFTCWARRFIGPTERVPWHWQAFLADLPPAIRDRAGFVGLLRDDIRFTPPERVRYDCAVIVDWDEDMPDTLHPLAIGPMLAATIRHQGGYGFDRQTGLCVANTYAFLLDEWLSASRHSFAGDYTLEFYADRPGQTEPDMVRCMIAAPII